MKKVSTGVALLDKLLGGGFSEGSTIVVAGPPGTGKTIFSMAYLSKLEDGIGMRISLNEDSKAFLEFSSMLGYACKKLYEEKKLKLIDLFPTRKELFEQAVRYIVDEIEKYNVKKLVVDSFTAFIQHVDSSSEVRNFIQSTINNIIRRKGVTSLLIVESPIGIESIGFSIEEFAADGVLMFKKRIYEGRLLRELEIEKMRGTLIEYPRWFFTLRGGFNMLGKSSMIEGRRREFKVVKLGKGLYSSGITTLDEIVGGGFRRGSIVLFEIGSNAAPSDFAPILEAQIINFLKQRYFTFVLPPLTMDPDRLREELSQYVDKEVLEKYFVTTCPMFTEEGGKEIALDMMFRDLTKEEGAHYLWMVDWDSAEEIYGHKKLIKQLTKAFVAERGKNFLIFLIVRETDPAINELSSFSSYHLKVDNMEGTPFIYGIKPYTGFYGIESGGDLTDIKLIEVV